MKSKITKERFLKNAAVIVAHPDDETLWTGGAILMHPEINWTVITLCRLSDPDRSPKFPGQMHLNFKGFQMQHAETGPACMEAYD